MGEVIYLDEWQERRKPKDKGAIQLRLAEIAMEKMLLQSEEEHLKSMLNRE